MLVPCFRTDQIRIVTGDTSIDNHTPGPGPGRLVPSSHQRSELSNSILGIFRRGDNRVWKCISIPNCLGENTILIRISNGDLKCRRMMIPAAPNRGIRSSVGMLALPVRPLFNNMSIRTCMPQISEVTFLCIRKCVNC